MQEGRNFVVGSEDLYDAIQITMIDSWAGAAAGAYLLNKNSLDTLEAVTLQTTFVPWGWGVNGALSVLAPILSIAISLNLSLVEGAKYCAEWLSLEAFTL